MNQVQMFRVRRPALDVPQGPKIHRGIAAKNVQSGQVVVLHNTPGPGEHLGSIEEFRAGLEIAVEPIPVTQGMIDRFNAVAAYPRAYDVLANNCEHTATAVEEGKRRSQTLDLLALLAGLFLIGVAVGR